MRVTHVRGDLHLPRGVEGEVGPQRSPLRPTGFHDAVHVRVVAREEIADVRVFRAAAYGEAVALNETVAQPRATFRTRHVLEAVTVAGDQVGTGTLVEEEPGGIVGAREVQVVEPRLDLGIPGGRTGRPALGEDL